MAFNELRAAVAAMALLAASGAPVAAQSPTPAPAAPVAAAGQQRLQTPAEPAEEAAVGEMEPAGADVQDEAEPVMSAEELAEETRQCQTRRRKAIKQCLGMDLQCRAAALTRERNCLAALKQQ